jgi:cytochrome c heme-lyase
MKNMLGYGKPFDRHDWTIQRSDNTQQRYVIDYYFDEEKSQEDEVPQLHSATSVKSISMYARPAIDDVEGLFDRIKFPIMTLIQQLQEPNLSARQALLDKTNQEKQQDHENTSSSALSVEEVEQTFEKIKETCKNCFDQVKTCTNESQCSQAATALQLCMANIICKKEAIAFTKALEKGDDKQVEQAFDAMNTSLEIFQEKSAIVMRVQAEKEAFSQK